MKRSGKEEVRRKKKEAPSFFFSFFPFVENNALPDQRRLKRTEHESASRLILLIPVYPLSSCIVPPALAYLFTVFPRAFLADGSSGKSCVWQGKQEEEKDCEKEGKGKGRVSQLGPREARKAILIP